MKQVFKNLLVAAVLLQGVSALAADCTRYCNPEKSKPCGKSCIAKDFTCHKPVTTACVGKRPDKKAWQYTPSEAEAHLNKILGLN